MRAFAYVAPTFWTRGSGKKLRGNFRAQALALYVMTAPSSNMIGLYYVPATTISAETGIAITDLLEAFAEIEEIAKYDFENEIMWVPEASAHQIGTMLKFKDKRRPVIVRELAAVGSHPFSVEFYDKYGEAYDLDPLIVASEIDFQDAPSTQEEGTFSFTSPSPSLLSESEKATEPEPAKKKTKAAKQPETPLPEPFPLTEQHLQHAKEKGWPDWWFKHVHDCFVGCAKAKGWKYVIWDAALYNFARNQIGYKKGPLELAHMAPKRTAAPVAPSQTHEARQAALQRELASGTARAKAELENAGIPQPRPSKVDVRSLLSGVGQ